MKKEEERIPVMDGASDGGEETQFEVPPVPGTFYYTFTELYPIFKGRKCLRQSSQDLGYDMDSILVLPNHLVNLSWSIHVNELPPFIDLGPLTLEFPVFVCQEITQFRRSVVFFALQHL